MKTCIVSYSMTNNNERLGKALSEEIAAEHIIIKEPKERKIPNIILDMLLRRTPRILNNHKEVLNYEKIIFMGPVWMQQPATPLRIYFKLIRKERKPYAFISISGGALNDNPKLKGNIIKLAGNQIQFFKDLHISKLLNIPNVKMSDTSNYSLTDKDIELLKSQIIKEMIIV